MPELPEVETTRRILHRQVVGRKVKDVRVAKPQIVATGADEMIRGIKGRSIIDLGRRGKYLTMEFDDSARVTLHLRMTGSLIACPKDHPEEKHTHIVFEFDDDSELRFIDPRRFGRFWYMAAGDDDASGITKLGPEPLDDGFDNEYLAQAFAKKKRSIKQCLLDQEVIAGIGNIYADESLFVAGIHPECSAGSLDDNEIERLAKAIPFVIERAIEDNDISDDEYLLGGGRKYRSAGSIFIYGHGGEACPECKTPLEHISIAGRGTTFCPSCQK